MLDKVQALKRINASIRHQEVLLVPYHDASEHKYQEDKNNPGVCKHCGWYAMQNSPRLDCCGRTLREHAEEHLRMMKSFKMFVETATTQELIDYEDHANLFLERMKQIAESNKYRDDDIFPIHGFTTISIN